MTIGYGEKVIARNVTLEVRRGQKVVIVGENGKVITTEIIPELAEFAGKNLKNAGIKNVRVIRSDGSLGCEAEAPYDRCIITAACPKVPPPLFKQLKNNGIIVAPVGSAWGQSMIKIRKKHGKLETENLGEFVFVPLKGAHGWV